MSTGRAPSAGPAGALRPAFDIAVTELLLPFFGGIWNFSKSKPAAKSLLAHLSSRSACEQLVAASQGYDLPAWVRFNDFHTWADEGPPKGTLYHYPNREDQVAWMSGAPAPPKIAT